MFHKLGIELAERKRKGKQLSPVRMVAVDPTCVTKCRQQISVFLNCSLRDCVTHAQVTCCETVLPMLRHARNNRTFSWTDHKSCTRTDGCVDLYDAGRVICSRGLCSCASIMAEHKLFADSGMLHAA